MQLKIIRNKLTFFPYKMFKKLHARRLGTEICENSNYQLKVL